MIGSVDPHVCNLGVQDASSGLVLTLKLLACWPKGAEPEAARPESLRGEPVGGGELGEEGLMSHLGPILKYRFRGSAWGGVHSAFSQARGGHQAAGPHLSSKHIDQCRLSLSVRKDGTRLRVTGKSEIVRRETKVSFTALCRE